MNEMTIETINERIEILKQNFGVEFELEDDKVYLVTPEDDMFDEGLDVESFISYTEDIENMMIQVLDVGNTVKRLSMKMVIKVLHI